MPCGFIRYFTANEFIRGSTFTRQENCVAGKEFIVKMDDSKDLAVKRIAGIRATGQNLAVIESSEPFGWKNRFKVV